MIGTTLAVGAGLLHGVAGVLLGAALLRRDPDEPTELPQISIVVPARNEAANLPRLLRSLAKLDYPVDKVELVLVNDDSTDNTRDVAVRLGADLPFRVRIIDAVHHAGETLPPTKTLPLAQGIDAAQGELILMTDGDCEVQPSWARDVVRHFEPGVGLVCGITLPDYDKAGDRITRYEAVDWSLLLGVCAGMCRLGSPLALIGNNYAVRRTCYDSVGTFRKIEHNRIDDIALFRAVAESGKWTIAFAVTPGACAATLPIGGTRDIVKQRYRWMEGFAAVNRTGKLLFGFGLTTHLLWPLALLLGWPAAFITIAAILIGDWAVIAAGLIRLGKRGLRGYALTYPVWACLYGWQLLVAMFVRPEIKWKERKLA